MPTDVGALGRGEGRVQGGGRQGKGWEAAWGSDPVLTHTAVPCSPPPPGLSSWSLARLDAWRDYGGV